MAESFEPAPSSGNFWHIFKKECFRALHWTGKLLLFITFARTEESIGGFWLWMRSRRRYAQCKFRICGILREFVTAFKSCLLSSNLPQKPIFVDQWIYPSRKKGESQTLLNFIDQGAWKRGKSFEPPPSSDDFVSEISIWGNLGKNSFLPKRLPLLSILTVNHLATQGLCNGEAKRPMDHRKKLRIDVIIREFFKNY